jgi:trehalose 6-phosphate phosphatase
VKYALAAEGIARIAAFLTPRTLLAFDIDGTLAPIVERPWDARVPDAVQRGLGALAQRAAVAIITGRAIEDARPMLAFTPRYLVGNHGAEGVPGFERASAHCARVCRAWLDALTEAPEPWRDIPGVVLEDKTFSLTFHFRHAPNHDAARDLLAARVGRLLPAPTLLDGKYVLNVLPPGAPHKGEALAALQARSRCARALYVGDDASDEAVFRMQSPAVLSVRVERDPKSAANLYLRGQKDITRFVRELQRLLGAASAPSPPQPRPGAEA